MEISTVLPAYADEVDAPLLPTRRVAARGVPGAGGAARRARSDRPSGSGSGRAAGGACASPQGSSGRSSSWCARWRPAASSSRPRRECAPPRTGSPSAASVSYDVQNVIDPPAGRHGDLPGEPLVGDVGDLRVDVLVPGVRLERPARLVVPRRRPALELRELVGRQDAAGRDERRPPERVAREDGIVEAPREPRERVVDADGVERRSRRRARRWRRRGSRRGSTAARRWSCRRRRTSPTTAGSAAGRCPPAAGCRRSRPSGRRAGCRRRPGVLLAGGVAGDHHLAALVQVRAELEQLVEGQPVGVAAGAARRPGHEVVAGLPDDGVVVAEHAEGVGRDPPAASTS